MSTQSPARPGTDRSAVGRPAARSRRRPVTAVLTWVGLVILLIWTLGPVAVMVFSSFKQADEIYAVPTTLLPHSWTLANYVSVFTASNMPHALVNSLLIGLMVAAATLILCFSAGYAFARFKFPGSRPIALFILLGQVVPLTVLLLPIYKMITGMHLGDSIIGIALTHLVITVPLVTWMIRNQIAGLPVDLEEAAMIDGGSRFDAVTYITLPVAAPGLAAAGMFAFLQSWHEFLFASVLADSPSSKTAPVALTEFANEYQVNWGATMAASVVLTVPVVILFVALQRYFVAGLTGGAVKG